MCLLPDCRNGKRGQGWERKYVVLEGNKVLTYETEPREGHYFSQLMDIKIQTIHGSQLLKHTIRLLTLLKTHLVITECHILIE